MAKVMITGAHFTPAQAVISELKKIEALQIVYVGRKTTREGDQTRSVESVVLPKLGVEYRTIITGRLQRSFSLYTIPSLLKIPIGFIQAFYFLIKEKPDVLLSFGGYVAVPLVVVSWLLSIPIITHDQTLVIGLASNISNLFADKIAISYELEKTKSLKMVVTGNPIREEVLRPVKKVSWELEKFFERAKREKKPIILITGGNQGSHIINETIERSLDKLLERAFIIHQTGDSKYQDFERLKALQEDLDLKKRYFLKKWVDGSDLGVIFRQVSMVVSRAGANTLLELSLVGVPTLVIPIPDIQKDEQTVNARFFEKQGLAKVLLQKDLSEEKLIESIEDTLKDLPKLKKEALGASGVVVLDAAKRLSLETLLLIKEKI